MLQNISWIQPSMATQNVHLNFGLEAWRLRDW